MPPAQRPERRPRALEAGQFHARLDPAKLKFGLTHCIEPRRRVLLAKAVLFKSGDFERAVAYSNVLRAVAVVLQFVVPAAIAVHFYIPVIAVKCIAVELVAPYKFALISISQRTLTDCPK